MPLIGMILRHVILTVIMCEMLQIFSILKGGQKPSRNKWLSIPFSRYISAYVEGFRAADVLQKCTSENVLNCKKCKRAGDIK